VNLQQFTGSKKIWNQWLEGAQLTEALVYLQELSDSDAKKFLTVAAEHSNLAINQFLKNFGTFIAPKIN
jgi:hypothetical protein